MYIQKLDFLFGLYLTAIVTAELMGGKIFTLMGVNASVAIFAFPITFTINDIVTEVYGKKRALSFVRTATIMLIILVGFNLLATWLPPAARFSSNDAYVTIFSKSRRIILASLAAFWVSERFDVYIFSKMRDRFGTSKLWFRNNVSNFISQLFDTSLFILLAFYEPGKLWFIASLIWPYWLLKCAASIVETPFTYWGVQWLRNEASSQLTPESKKTRLQP